ncbi:nucleotidyltransferase [Laribacter hongkongensis]|uniref:nucleotidyltransferase n=1 Tax=Laribacter hongkongensis TaxID=168471 RepID=UPI001EFCACAC|nr:nucleotidyltransferase [Laribacter hongkongensis]MCG9124886.1 nucleotidyltransferase [Laribacter hongkongensis]
MTSNIVPPSTVTAAASAYLERLAAELDVPPSRYEEAKRRYKSVGEWLGREESTLKDLDPEVYVQGSFRLGVPIRPVNEDEHYDVDLVCELTAADKQRSQRQLKELLGHEMKLYAKAHGMKEVGESRRCWTLEYADGAQFHLDALPAIPDGEGQRRVLAARGLSNSWTETAIAITDNEHPLYDVVDDAWPHSNPKGYTNWFRSRMRIVFEARRGAMALEAKAAVEDIPSYRVKTPLQQAVQILKRHRDLMFANDQANKPISVILTTLAGMAYQNEATVGQALDSILRQMDSFIGVDAEGFSVILNPTDPAENFADRWRQYPKRRENFYQWLQKARSDFAELASQYGQRLVEVAERFAGPRIAARAGAPSSSMTRSLLSLLPNRAALISAPHKQQVPWPVVRQGQVRIAKATWRANGFSRPMRFYNDSQPLRKGASLNFEADTDIPAPYDVYWQVVNSGVEAAGANQLRGGFDRGAVERGSVVRKESTAYAGSHTIECFIVKQGHLVARSGTFIVNIS